MHLTQIFFRDDPYSREPLPASLEAAIQSAKAAFLDHTYHQFDIPRARDFIACNFDHTVLDAFDCLKPYAYKSDLARYCILYILGGWYVDISLKILNPIRVTEEADLVAFADRGCPSCAPWAIQNGLFYTKPRSPILESSIQAVLKNVQNRFYGNSPFDPTGPNCFGRTVSQHSKDLTCLFGEFRPLTPGLSFVNLMYISSSGYLIAQHKSSWAPGLEGGDFNKLGANGTNNYKDLWHARDIYH